jgi:hypothetical protein
MLLESWKQFEVSKLKACLHRRFLRTFITDQLLNIVQKEKIAPNIAAKIAGEKSTPI